MGVHFLNVFRVVSFTALLPLLYLLRRKSKNSPRANKKSENCEHSVC